MVAIRYKKARISVLGDDITQLLYTGFLFFLDILLLLTIREYMVI